jgi:hypothetical protein
MGIIKNPPWQSNAKSLDALLEINSAKQMSFDFFNDAKINNPVKRTIKFKSTAAKAKIARQARAVIK